MRRLTFTFIITLFLTNLGSAQRTFNYSDFTKAEQDSLRKGIVTPDMLAKFQEGRRRDSVYRDSFIRTRIVNQPILDFDARDTAGVMHRPAMYRGRVWIIYLWEFWENPFQYEIPSLNAVVDSLRGEGVEVLSFLNYDLGESEKKYLENHLVHFPIVENSKKFGDDFFGLNLFRPIVAIVDKRGIIRHFYDVQKLHQGFKGHVNELLEENKKNLPTYDFMEKVKILLRE